MGYSISCSSFKRFSSFLEWALKRRSGCRAVVHYLDDFLFAGQAGLGQCAHLLTGFQELCIDLGVPLAEKKTEDTSSTLTFLGIELDSLTQTSRIPVAKLADLRECVFSFLSKRKVTLLELQQLVRHLNFTCNVVAPGRTFLHRLCDGMKGLQQPYYRMWVLRGMQEDLMAWQGFFSSFNGVSFLHQDLYLEAELQVNPMQKDP